MIEIDWSKAPEGAEFWREMQWFKTVDGEWRVWCPGINSWVKPSYAAPDNFSWWGNAVERPASPQWASTGLPPVGTVCEVSVFHINKSEWTEIEILAHAKHEDDDAVLVCEFDENERKSTMHGVIYAPHIFRPIRTQAQIEAEEREKEIDAMVAVSPMLDKTWSRKVCVALYDAGYRKQGEAK